jgi:hypothetical protein
VFDNPVAHCTISTLPLAPHPQQRRVSGIDEINDPDIGLGSVLTVKAAGVLLQGSLPRDRHCQQQRVERWMIEAFADQLADREQNARCLGR